MTTGTYLHHHRTGTAGQVEIHYPDGRTCGYVQRVGVQGQSRPGYIPLDTFRRPLAAYQDTQYRAIEFVSERDWWADVPPPSAPIAARWNVRAADLVVHAERGRERPQPVNVVVIRATLADGYSEPEELGAIPLGVGDALRLAAALTAAAEALKDWHGEHRAGWHVEIEDRCADCRALVA